MISRQKIMLLKKYFATQPVDVVYLFGSQVKGKSTKLSDADLAVLFKQGLSDSQRFDLRLSIIPKVCGILKMERVDVVDLQEASLKFKYQAIYPKSIIFLANPGRIFKFESEVTKNYLDIKPFFFNIAKRQLELTAEKGFDLL